MMVSIVFKSGLFSNNTQLGLIGLLCYVTSIPSRSSVSLGINFKELPCVNYYLMTETLTGLTRPSSTRFVTMMILRQFTCHAMCQMSPSVCLLGPANTFYYQTLKDVSRLN